MSIETVSNLIPICGRKISFKVYYSTTEKIGVLEQSLPMDFNNERFLFVSHQYVAEFYRLRREGKQDDALKLAEEIYADVIELSTIKSIQ